MKIIVSILIVFLYSSSSAQFSSVEIKNLVQNNIISYQIVQLVESNIESSGKEVLKSERFSGDWINLLMKGQKSQLLMDMKEVSDKPFPDTNYRLYSINIDKFIFEDSISGNGLLVSIPNYYSVLDSPYLIAVHNSERKILFISGGFFKTQISDYFQIVNNDSLVRYLRFKLYSSKLTGFEVVAETNKEWVVNAKDENNSEVVVRIPKKTPDIIEFVR
tara:strand:- start:64 stop:717 length:654 start_codon:yes stop_codon:yes gene_type:complete